MITKRRLVVLAGVAVAAAALVGFSAAATIATRDDSSPAVKSSKSRAAVSQGDLASSSKGQQTPSDIGSYWTKQRMRDARPVEKTRPGGPTSSMPEPAGKGASAGASPGGAATDKPSSSSAPAGRHSKSQGAPKPDDIVTGPVTNGESNKGWTQDEMDRAQPMEKTVEGGDGDGGASAPPGDGVGAGVP